MLPRYAILDDNQRLLEQRLADLRARLPALISSKICAARVIGSVAAGRARDQSDIDVVLVLASGVPARADYRWWEADVTPQLPDGGRFPVQPLFISRASVTTNEPNLRCALDAGFTLWDPEGIFDDESEARA